MLPLSLNYVDLCYIYLGGLFWDRKVYKIKFNLKQRNIFGAFSVFSGVVTLVSNNFLKVLLHHYQKLSARNFRLFWTHILKINFPTIIPYYSIEDLVTDVSFLLLLPLSLLIKGVITKKVYWHVRDDTKSTTVKFHEKILKIV